MWAFLGSGAIPEAPAERDPGSGPTPLQATRAVVDTDPLAICVRSIGVELLARGKTEATSKDIRERIPRTEGTSYTEHHLGSVMALLGLTSRRVWVNGSRPRVYDLRGLSPDGRSSGMRKGDRTTSNPPLTGPEGQGTQPD